jgi:hypothetical protein
MHFRSIVVAAALSCALSAQSPPCELAVNGGFETGDFTGWTLFPSAPGNITTVSPGASGSFAASIDNRTLASASLIKNANIGVGVVRPGQGVTISFQARGTTAAGGVAFAEFFSELAGGGTSRSEILGGAPLPLDPDPNAWRTFSFTTTAGPDVSGGVTLQLTGTTGGAPGSVASIQYDDISVALTQELAVNGGFETGDLSDWTLFPSTPGNISIASPGASGSFAAFIDNQTLASASLIKNANIGLGAVAPGQTVTISFRARGTTAAGGVAFAEFFSELAGGGTSRSEILGGAPLALDPDPNAWRSFRFTAVTGPDVSGGVTLQLTGTTGGAPGSVASIYYDDISVSIAPASAYWQNYGTGWPGANGVPSLELDAAPILGRTVNILLGNASGSTAVAGLLFGNEQTSTATALGGTLLTNLLVPLAVPPLSVGGGSTPLAVPNDGSLCGAVVYVQLLHQDAAASAGVAFSRGLRIAVGG